MRERGCEIGIKIVGNLRKLKRLYICFSRIAIKTCQGAKIIIVCLQALGRFALSPRHFGPLKLRCDRAYYAHRNAILQVENVFEGAVVSVCPDVITRRGINELPGDANAIARLLDAPLEYVTHPKFAPDLLDVDSFAFVGEAGIAGDDEQRF